MVVRGRSILISFSLGLHLWLGATAARATEPIAPRFDDVDVRETPEATYKTNAYEIVHVGRTPRVNDDDSWWRPVRGNYRLSIDHDAFFASLGRPDLAAQFRSRRSLGRTLEVGGFVTAIAGVIVVPYSLYKGSLVGAGIGAGMALGGLMMRGAGADLQKPTFPEDQALDMAARYNEALRAHVGLRSALPLTIGGRF
jgi:hypothetical protein